MRRANAIFLADGDPEVERVYIDGQRYWSHRDYRYAVVFATLVGAIIGFFFGFLRWGL